MKFNSSLRKGLSFGITSGIITTLGLMMGLEAGTHSRLAVLGGIITIAVADAFSDALGVHVSEESENRHSHKEIWQATFSTFLAKFLVASSIAVPVIFLELETAVNISILWGISLLVVLSYFIARQEKQKPLNVILEHVFIAVLVLIIANFLGQWAAATFT